ncbi:unnamed protein product, partial [marine sediment metagenome]
LDTLSNISSEKSLLQAIPADWVFPTVNHDRVRQPLNAALESPDLSYVSKRGFYAPRTARRIRQCDVTYGALHAWEDGARWMVLPLTCNSVACPLCARLKSIDRARRAARIAGLDHASLRWMTFTIENPPPGRLVDSMDRMGQAFRFLRHNKSGEAWARHVRGSLWAFEVTHNVRADTWHPHYHVLFDGLYWPRAALLDAWQARCRRQGLVGSVYIGRAHNRGRPIESVKDKLAAVIEVTKYTVKPLSEGSFKPNRIAELLDALYRRRTHGSAGSLALLRDPETPVAWKWIAPLSRFDNALADEPGRRYIIDGIMASLEDKPLLKLSLLRSSQMVHDHTPPPEFG